MAEKQTKMHLPVRRLNRLLICLILLGMSGCLPAAAAPRTLPTAPAATPTASGRGTGGTLTMLYWQAPAVLNPHLAPSTKDQAACRITYEPLASFDRDGNLVPFLAAEIPGLDNGGVALDGKSVTWKLRQDVKWSDGEPFTAADVVFTYHFAVNPDLHTTSMGSYSRIASVEAVDDYTVLVRFKEVNPAWAQSFVGVTGMILPEHAFAAYSDPLQAPVNHLPIGTGPYRAVSFKPQEVLFLGSELIETNKLVFEANPYYREANKPYFGRIILKGGGTVDEAARAVFQVGDVDFTHYLDLMDAGDLAALQTADAKGQLISQFGAFVERILLNRTDPNRATADGERSSLEFPHPFFSDLRVRQAFSLAIDRQAIAQVYGPSARPTANNLVSPGRYASPNTAYEFNLSKAAALLDAAGWVDSDGDSVRDKNGVRLSVTYQTPVNKQRQQIQAIIKQSLESIGVEVHLKVIDSSVFFSSDPANPGTRFHFYADMEQYASGNLVPDPGAYMGNWTCAQIPQQANQWTGRNLERWCSPEYEALFARAAVEMDPEARSLLFIAMNDLLINDVVMIPLGHRADIFGASKTLQGIDLTPWDAETWKIQDWIRVTP